MMVTECQVWYIVGALTEFCYLIDLWIAGSVISSLLLPRSIALFYIVCWPLMASLHMRLHLIAAAHDDA